jgi:hypothetical protein
MPHRHPDPVTLLHAAHVHALAGRPPLAICQAHTDPCRPTTPDAVVPQAILRRAAGLTAHRLSQRRPPIKGRTPAPSRVSPESRRGPPLRPHGELPFPTSVVTYRAPYPFLSHHWSSPCCLLPAQAATSSAQPLTAVDT